VGSTCTSQSRRAEACPQTAHRVEKFPLPAQCLCDSQQQSKGIAGVLARGGTHKARSTAQNSWGLTTRALQESQWMNS